MGWTTIPVGDEYTFHTWDEGDGDPVLYLHGFDGLRGETEFLARLARSRRVIAPELPGYGDSTGFEHIEDTLDMTLALRRLVETLGVERVDVVGHSLGGMFAAELAAISPHLVGRVVLVSPFGLWIDKEPIPDLFVLNPNQLTEMTWHSPAKATSVATASELANGHDQIATALQTTANLSVASKFLWPIPDRGLRKRLPLIHAKTLIVRGESDQLIPATYGEAFADLIPGAESMTIGECGHYPMFEQPEQFTGILESFLTGSR